MKTLEKGFLDEVAIPLGLCTCSVPTCSSVLYKIFKDKKEYIIDYNSSSNEANIVIYLTQNDDDIIVFSGKCDTEHDLAQVLRMVII